MVHFISFHSIHPNEVHSPQNMMYFFVSVFTRTHTTAHTQNFLPWTCTLYISFKASIIYYLSELALTGWLHAIKPTQVHFTWIILREKKQEVAAALKQNCDCVSSSGLWKNLCPPNKICTH